jgi:hypothetical protein
MNAIMKNNIIIIFCIFGIFLYSSKIPRTTEDKLLFITGYIVFIIVLIYALNKPSKKKYKRNINEI